VISGEGDRSFRFNVTDFAGFPESAVTSAERAVTIPKSHTTSLEFLSFFWHTPPLLNERGEHAEQEDSNAKNHRNFASQV
jgi:hypothetical protein